MNCTLCGKVALAEICAICSEQHDISRALLSFLDEEGEEQGEEMEKKEEKKEREEGVHWTTSQQALAEGGFFEFDWLDKPLAFVTAARFCLAMGLPNLGCALVEHYEQQHALNEEQTLLWIHLCAFRADPLLPREAWAIRNLISPCHWARADMRAVYAALLLKTGHVEQAHCEALVAREQYRHDPTTYQGAPLWVLAEVFLKTKMPIESWHDKFWHAW